MLSCVPGRPHRSALGRHVPLDDHIGALQQRSWVEQPTEDRRGTSERQIGDNLEPHAREREALQVVLDDSNLWKSPPQAGGQFCVDLHCDHGRSAADERGRQSARSGTEVEDEVFPPNRGSPNKLRCELATAEKVLAASATVSRSDGHGRPPCSCLPPILRFADDVFGLGHRLDCVLCLLD